MARSRGEIDTLLRSWGCSGVSWTDEFEEGWVRLEFKWKRQEQVYLARFQLKIPDDKAIRQQVRDTPRGWSQTKYENLCASRGRQEHRVLLLWLKAALNAVEVGIIDPALIFLPFLVGRNGKTFGDVALPKLPTLLLHDAGRLLVTGETD